MLAGNMELGLVNMFQRQTHQGIKLLVLFGPRMSNGKLVSGSRPCRTFGIGRAAGEC